MMLIKKIKTIKLTALFTLGLILNANGQTLPDSLISSIYEQSKELVLLDDPIFGEALNQEMSAKDLADLGLEQVYENTPLTFTMKDDKKLTAYKYTMESEVTVLLLHGVLSSAYVMNKNAGLIRESLNAEVIALDLRGHGSSEGKPGDIDYDNQLTDDLAEVIANIKQVKPKGKIILAGHSLGGGVALTYAERNDVPEVDGYLFFAPHLGQNSPTVLNQETSEEAASFIQIHLWRILGINMLHTFDDHKFDHLPVLFFNVPDFMPIKSYSFIFNASSSPKDYEKALRAIDKPMLVLVGSDDQAFVAKEFERAIGNFSSGKLEVIKGENHNGIRHNVLAMEHVNKWGLENNFLNH